MAQRCPVSLAPLLTSPVRRWLADPVRMLRPWVSPGQRVLDMGCGAGFHSAALAHLAGPKGEVVLADIQQEMLDRAVSYCQGAAGDDPAKLTPLLVPEAVWPLEGEFDFVLLHWVLHEVSDQAGMWRALAGHLRRPAGSVLVVEPRMHVSGRVFEAAMQLPVAEGLTVTRRWGSPVSRWAVIRSAAEQ